MWVTLHHWQESQTEYKGKRREASWGLGLISQCFLTRNSMHHPTALEFTWHNQFLPLKLQSKPTSSLFKLLLLDNMSEQQMTNVTRLLGFSQCPHNHDFGNCYLTKRKWLQKLKINCSWICWKLRIQKKDTSSQNLRWAFIQKTIMAQKRTHVGKPSRIPMSVHPASHSEA